MAEGPDEMDELLTPDSVVNVYEEVLPAQNKSFILGLMLNLPEEKVESIRTKYLEPCYRLLHILIEFTKQTDPKPTRRVIVDALKSHAVNLPALASKVEKAHLPKPSQLTQHCLPAAARMTLVMPTSGEVKREISELNTSFKEYKDTVKECLKRRKTVKDTVDVLTSAECEDHHKVLLDSRLEKLLKAKDHDQLFISMNFHWNYLDPTLLDNLVVYFNLEGVKGQMEAYNSSLREFRIKTPLTVFCQTQKRRMGSSPSCPDKVHEFEWPQNITLECVEVFRRQFMHDMNLRDCAMMVAEVHGFLSYDRHTSSHTDDIEYPVNAKRGRTKE